MSWAFLTGPWSLIRGGLQAALCWGLPRSSRSRSMVEIWDNQELGFINMKFQKKNDLIKLAHQEINEFGRHCPGVLVLFVSGTVWLQQGSILICFMMTPIETCFWKKENGFAIMAYFIFFNSVPSVPCRCLLQTFNASWTNAFLASAQLLSSQLRSLTVMMMMKFTVWSPFCPGLNETTKRLNTRGLPGC